MTRLPRHDLRRAVAVFALPLAALLLAGCFNPFDPLVARGRAGVSDPAPVPSRPELIVRLFEWCWEHRSITDYEEVFSDDFLFAFAATDSAGRAFQGAVLTRNDEIETARHLFVGGGTSPPANSISLQLDQNLFAEQDTRPGKRDTTYHREIVTNVVLRIETEGESFQVIGAARFFVVRGDSALIPQDLVDRGFRPDPARWYIERWEDETLGSEGANSAVRDRGWSGLSARRSSSDAMQAAGNSAAQYGPLDVSWGFVKSVFYARR
jgi:hypothetical protein